MAAVEETPQEPTMFKMLMGLLLVLVSSLSFAAVDLNKASQADLESIKGIGPAMSTRILDERKKSEFKDWLDFVDRVKGVGPGNASKFSAAGLTVNGAPYVPAGATPPKGASNNR
jgi:competence protein ComEA